MIKKAAFAAGCFWHVEYELSQLNGVLSATSGYMGGDTTNPTYKEVCSGITNHAETVQIEYDPKIIRYENLLKKFWEIHNPTQHNRQGPDSGTQYRSAIFHYDQSQKKSAEKSLKEEQKKHEQKITTEIIPAKEFYKAEEYHQKYYEKNKIQSCGMRIIKKLF